MVALIVGHTEVSLRYNRQGTGEMANTRALAELTDGTAVDVHEVLEGRVRLGKGPIISVTYLSKFLELHGRSVTAARALAFTEDQPLQMKLYGEVDLVLTPSLLTRERALEEGLEPERALYLPYQLSEPLLQFKRRAKLSEKFVVGCATRFEFRRNVEFLIRAFAQVHQEIPDAILWLKGDLDHTCDYAQGEGYTERLRRLIESVEGEPWFHWDRERRASAEEGWEVLNGFDLGVHLGGTEDPTNVVIEMLALGKPVLMLETCGRGDMFGNAVTRTPHAGYSKMRQGTMSFFVPEPQALAENLVRLVRDEKGRRDLGVRAKNAALVRFSPRLARARIEWVLAPNRFRKEILAAVEDDQKRFCDTV
jgi:glycosyltransferase involved in cell wall biosynthesis